MQSYQALIAGQAGPDNPYRFGSTPSKHVMHLAKVAPVGRSSDAARSAATASPLISAISPYENPYNTAAGSAASLPNTAISPYEKLPTATPGPVASPSPKAITRMKYPPLAISEPVADPSKAADGAATSPPIVPDARPVTPALFAGNDSISIPSSPRYQFSSRSLFPDAAELIETLANYDSFSDDDLYDAVLKAQQAMAIWKDEYLVHKTQISNMRRFPRGRRVKRKLSPKKLRKEKPEKWDFNYDDSLQQPTPNVTKTMGKKPQNTARTRTAKPINMPNELHIDMNEPMQPLEGKRIRKPRIIDNDDTPATAPKKSLKRAREPDHSATKTPTTGQPAAKKQHLRARSITPPDWVRTFQTVTKEPTPAPLIESRKQGQPAKAVVKKQSEVETKGKDPVRAAAARLMWAKRQANGTNGRHGGTPKARNVAKGKGKEEEGGNGAGEGDGMAG